MKIIHVSPRYYPNRGGVENHVREICERLSGEHSIEVVTADLLKGSPRSEIINDVKITRFKSIGPKEAYYFSPGILSYLKKTRADIVHAHNYHAFPALFASLARPGRFVFTPHYHGKGSTYIRNLLNKPYSLIGKSIFYRADRIICVSAYERDLVRKNFPKVAFDKMDIIPNGIPVNQIQGAKPGKTIENLVLYIGRLDRYKNIQVIIRAMQYLPEASFYIIGSSGNYRNQLEGLIDHLGLNGRVKILDNVSDAEKYTWLKSCSLFMNLSGTEAFGITVLEALTAGKQVIINGNGGLGEFATKFEGVTPVNADILTDEAGLRKFAALMNEKMGNDIPADVSGYDWDNIVKRIESLYLGLFT